MSAEQRQRHEDNRRRLLAAGWRESERAGNRWWPPRSIRAVDRIFGGPKRWTIDEYADRFPCSTLDALNELSASEELTIGQSFARGELLVSAVRALPDRVFAFSPWGPT